MIRRREFVKVAAAGASGLLLRKTLKSTPLPGGTLPPGSIPKYVTRLVIPPAMPQAGPDYYEIGVRQFLQRILPAGYNPTTVWSYGSAKHPATFNYPAFTIEAQWHRPVRIKWINQLVDASGNYLPHLLPVDPTLHWANPAGGVAGRDHRPHHFASTPGRYTGPVPIVTHVHGAHTYQESDGYPEAWYLPRANNIPRGYARTGTFYDIFKTSSSLGNLWEEGAAVFQYPNDQDAATLWYHDHALGVTRLNVYAGPAGFYLLRGGPRDLNRSQQLPGAAPSVNDSLDTGYYEIPLAIQDRSFNVDGSLFYPCSREFFDGFNGPFIPETPASPIWNPEFFGNTMVVNGRTWPYLEVEKRRYRFRILNGCNSRFLILKLSNGMPFWQIGGDGGFLANPVQLDSLLMSPAERADVIVDFSDLPAGTSIVMRNLGPDEPFGGGEPGMDFPIADPATTGQVMQFRVVAAAGRDPSTPPEQLRLPPITPASAPQLTRALTLNEEMYEPADIPVAALLGTRHKAALEWSDEITENPRHNSSEIWEFWNNTEDAHPIHLHLVQFEVVNRQPMQGGPLRPPEVWETGPKDTVIAYPGEITRIKARFDLAGRFVWHCHILEHEDNEMMRPYRVG